MTPSRPREGDQKTEKFQAPKNHQENADQQGWLAKATEVACRTKVARGRTNICQGNCCQLPSPLPHGAMARPPRPHDEESEKAPSVNRSLERLRLSGAPLKHELVDLAPKLRNAARQPTKDLTTLMPPGGTRAADRHKRSAGQSPLVGPPTQVWAS